MTTRPTPGQPGHFDVFFNVGSEFDARPSSGPVPLSLDGLSGAVGGSVQPESIYQVTLDARRNIPVLSNLQQVAKTADALYVADMSSVGPLSAGAFSQGVVYKIAAASPATGPPGAPPRTAGPAG